MAPVRLLPAGPPGGPRRDPAFGRVDDGRGGDSDRQRERRRPGNREQGLGQQSVPLDGDQDAHDPDGAPQRRGGEPSAAGILDARNHVSVVAPDGSKAGDRPPGRSGPPEPSRSAPDSCPMALPAARAVGRWLAVLLPALALAGLRAGIRRAAGIPFAPVYGRGRIGADWAARRGITGEPVAGEVERFSIYDRPGFDFERIHPEIRRFYEETGDYDLEYRTRWHPRFRLGAWLSSFVTSRLEQLNLPGRNDDRTRSLESELAAVPREVDPRGSRVWTRTDPDGRAVFVAVYAIHTSEDVTYANVAVPLPGSNLSTVLRPEHDGEGVRFTTRGPGDGGLYLVTPVGAVRLPMDQRFRVLPLDSADGGDVRPSTEDSDLVAVHEMWLCGRQFLTIRYRITR